MKFKMAHNSLFAILLRSPWWISILIAVVLSLIAVALLPAHLAPYAASAGFPFLIIGAIAGVRQLRAPSATQVAQILDTVGTMSWRDFSTALAIAFQRDGYAVTPLKGNAADFAISRAGSTALVSCKRWKASSHGVEPLRDLHAASQAHEASETIYIAVGQLSDNARRFAVEKKIRLIQGAALATFLQSTLRKAG
jgi:restriction system protein